MNARKLLEKALRDMGADGLCNDDPCGCGLDDLAPCGEIRDICVPAKADSDVPEENDLGEGDQLLDEGQSERLNGRIHELEADEMIGEVQRYMKETVKVDLDLSNAIAFMYGAWKDLIVEEALCRGEEPPTLKEF